MRFDLARVGSVRESEEFRVNSYRLAQFAEASLQRVSGPARHLRPRCDGAGKVGADDFVGEAGGLFGVAATHDDVDREAALRAHDREVLLQRLERHKRRIDLGRRPGTEKLAQGPRDARHDRRLADEFRVLV